MQKISTFPGNRDQRLESAVNTYDKGDYAAALPKFINLINDGCKEAYEFVGYIYEEGGGGVEQDLQKAAFYYKKSIEEFGALEAYLGLGRLYYHGDGVERDYAKAFELYSTVHEETDNPIAALMLGRMYQFGEGLTKDLVKAQEYYQKAANKGYVFGLTYQAILETELGNYLKGLWLRMKAAFLAFIISLKNPKDRKLRSC